MTFKPGARLDPGEVLDERGSSGGGGGGGFSFPGFGGGGRSQGGGIGTPAGGGIVGVVILVIVIGAYLLLNNGSTNGSGTGPLGSDASQCQTGAQANAREDCRIVGYVDSVQAYWTTELPKLGKQYTDAQTVLFSGSYNTGCGPADTTTGPFYCPNDGYVYLDTDFFNVLDTELGGTSAPLAQAYVIAHEYGHHVQDLQGTLQRMNDGDTGPTSPSVRIELQADCYAGVWAANAVSTGYIEPLSQSDVNDALTEAKAVGDDWIQQHSGGGVNPDQWTHGSSDQRIHWFTAGYNGGQPSDCDTFSTNNL